MATLSNNFFAPPSAVPAVSVSTIETRSVSEFNPRAANTRASERAIDRLSRLSCKSLERIVAQKCSVMGVIWKTWNNFMVNRAPRGNDLAQIRSSLNKKQINSALSYRIETNREGLKGKEATTRKNLANFKTGKRSTFRSNCPRSLTELPKHCYRPGRMDVSSHVESENRLPSSLGNLPRTKTAPRFRRASKSNPAVH